MQFIKNYSSLASTPNRKLILDLINEGLSSIQSKKVMESFSVEKDELIVKDTKIKLTSFNNIYLLGFGKGSAEVCQIIEEKLGNYLTKGWDIDVIDYNKFNKVSYTKGTHPLPSQENIDFTKNVVNNLSGLSKNDLVLIVICGGGSVLFELPYKANLETMQSIVNSLLHSGANINEMNIVRKHLSKIKGGNLAKVLYPAKVLGMIFSDVPGNSLSTIASGPTVNDNTTIEDVENVLDKYNIDKSIIIPLLTDTTFEKKYFINVENILMVSNLTALHSMSDLGRKKGYDCVIYSNKVQGDAHELGKFLISLTKSKTILLAGGESTIKVTGNGKGGRNQALIVSSLSLLNNDTIIAAFGTDGWDFYGFAGAIADSLTISKAKSKNLDPKIYLDNDDTYTFLKEIGDGIDTGKLESNVSDIYIVLKN